jgi:hypothetical protein
LVYGEYYVSRRHTRSQEAEQLKLLKPVPVLTDFALYAVESQGSDLKEALAEWNKFFE